MYRYINNDMFEKINDLHPYSFGIRFNGNIKTEEGKLIGQILFGIKITKKGLEFNDFVEFPIDKIKFRSTTFDEEGYSFCVVHQKWVKKFINNPKMKFSLKILKSRVIEGKREYYVEREEMELTYSQYITKRMLIDFGNYEYRKIAAYENFKQRFNTHHDYYRALNETCKHYIIQHDNLKRILAQIDNAKKQYKKEWQDQYTRDLENNHIQKMLDGIISESKNVDVGENNVIEFGLKRFLSD